MLAATVLLAVVPAACAGPAPDSVITIGAVYPLSGPQAPGGSAELAGVRAALAVARRHGDLAGREVRLKVVDARLPEDGTRAVAELVDRDHVALIVGSYGSAIAEAVAAEADRRHVFYLETGAVSEGVTRNRHYVFRTVANGLSLGTIAVDFAAQVLVPASGLPPAGARFVIVHIDDVYGRTVARGEERRAAERHLNVVDSIAYDPSTYDPAQLVARIAADRPDYLLDVSYLEDGIAIWEQLLRQQVGIRAVVGTSSAFCMAAFGSRLGARAAGVFAADKPDEHIQPGALDPEARALLAEARAEFARANRSAEMDIPAVAGFVGGWTLFHEILPRVKGGLSGDRLRAAALQVDVPVGGTINGGGVYFERDDPLLAGQNLRAAAVVGQWQPAGNGVVMRTVFPGGYATGRPIIRA